MGGERARFRAPARFAARTPLLPLAAFTEWADGAADLAALRRHLSALIDRPEVAEAIFVASPDLDKSIDAWRREPDSKRGQRVERSLVRYVSRMASRATPFGLFAAVSIGQFAEPHVDTAIELPAPNNYRRSTRIDNDYLFALCEALVGDPQTRARLTLRPNSSLYRVAGRLRYAESRLVGGARSHHLVAIEETPYLLQTIERAAAGAKRAELAAALVADDPEIELAEAEAFIDELVDSQVLVSRLSPNVTGPEPIDHIADCLGKAGCDDVAGELAAVRETLADIDRRGPGTPVTPYLQIAERLERLPAAVTLSRLFQVDTVAPLEAARLSRRVVSEIERAVATLARIAPSPRESALDRFASAFAARFESREVPLLDALDEEVGVGYAVSHAPGAEAAPLLAGLHFPPDPDAVQTAEWHARHAHLYELLAAAARDNASEIELTDRDIDRLSAPQPARLADAISVMATIVADSPAAIDRGDFKLLLENAGGPSGARILGRFCLADPDHDALVREHLRGEEALVPGAVFAEIIHLPEGRIGNILCRPVLRDHEIPFLGISGAAAADQIPVSDLLVSARQGRVVLRSRRLDREVIPRMTTAHNYSSRGLGVYRFLCDLQHQGTSGAGWSWGPLGNASFLPRVTHRRQVLSRARWRLSSDDLAPLAEASQGAKKAKTAEQIQALRGRAVAAARALRDARGLPRFVVLADFDNELPVDFDNELSLDSFVALVKNRSSADLYELYPGPADQVVKGPDGAHVHELVVPLVREREPTARPIGPLPGANAGRFASGSRWLYAKLYTGTATADDVLREVWPIAGWAMERGDAERWFFIRYGDPDWHLRVRFYGEPDRLRAEVLPALERAAAGLIDRGAMWRLQLDTYDRELTRYGGAAGIDLAEQLFCADSIAVAEIVDLLDGDEGEVARWQLALRGIDMLFDDLGFDLAERRELIGTARDGFASEHHANTALKKQLGARYREHAREIATLLARDPAIDAEHDYQPGFEALDRRSARQREIGAALRARSDQLTTDLGQLTLSLIHMHANRLLRSAARAQELVLYDMLRRHYDMVVSRAR